MKTSPQRPYLSLDLETTGLDPETHDILSMAMIYDTGKGTPEEQPYIHIKIKDPQVVGLNEISGSPVALAMNADLLQELYGWKESTEGEILNIQDAATKIYEFFMEHKIDSDNKVQVAGKNVHVFDLPLLINYFKRELEHSVSLFSRTVGNSFHHRALDVGSLYADIFGENVSLSKINKLTGREPVKHTAYEDALDVVYAVRFKRNAILKIESFEESANG